MSHPFMDVAARELSERGIATLRYQFPYMEQRARRPDPPKLAHATVRAAVAAVAKLAPARRRQVLRRPYDLAGAGRISPAGCPRPRLPRLSRAAVTKAGLGSLLAVCVGVTLDCAALEEQAHAGNDLPVLLGPERRSPFFHQVAPSLDPDIGGCLAPPEIEQIHAVFWVDADNRI